VADLPGPPESAAVGQRKRLMVWWLISTATLLAVLLAFAVFFVASTVGYFVHTGVGCLPADFPSYPKASVIEVDLAFGTPVQGDTKECRMRLISSDGFDHVNSFFRHRLSAGQWSPRGYSEDAGGSILNFYLKSRGLTYGAITVHKQLAGTPYDIQLFS
jgi:hypothetical protein